MASKFNLKTFNIDNFRVFDTETKFDIAPITILTGTNSSGKSSFTKALALLVKSYQTNGLHTLDFMSSNLNISGFNSIKNNRNEKQSIDFKLVFENNKNIYSLSLSFDDKRLLSFAIEINNSLILAKSIDSSFIKLSNNLINKEKVADIFYGLSASEIDLVCKKILHFLSSDYNSHQNSSEIDLTADSGLDFAKSHQAKIIDALNDLDGKNEGTFYDEETQSVQQYSVYRGSNPKLGDVIPELSIKFSVVSTPISTLLNLNTLESFEVFENDLLFNFFNSFEFVSAIRASQEIIFTPSNSPAFFKILANYQSNGNSGKANSILKKWLVDEFKLFKLKGEETVENIFKVEVIEGVGYLVRFLVNGVWTELASLGYGVTQLLPIILKIATNQRGNFVIEEPEANLHPALQSKMADFFLDILKPTDSLNKLILDFQSRSFIVETHSEYLIRKLQYLTASDSNLKPNDSVIYYFYQHDDVPVNEHQIKKITIKDNGSLSDNFGEGFIDEASSWKFELLRLNNPQKN